MRHRETFASLLVVLITVLCAAFAAPGALAESVRGSYSYDVAWLHYTVIIDAEIVDGAPTGTMVIRGWTTYYGRRQRLQPINYEILSLDIVGNEAWLIAREQGSNSEWLLHIVDNGQHGDTVNGQEIDGNFRVRE